jgi:hypothetical protein
MHVIVRRNGPAAFPSSSCSIPTATSSRSTRTVAMPSACRADANAACFEKVASFGRTSAVPLLSKACAGLRHTARLGAKYPTRPSSKLVASSPDNIFATADFHDFH